MTYGNLHSLPPLPPTNFIVITGQRWSQAIISMLQVKKLRPERGNALLEVTELQVDRRIWTQVSLTPEPRGSSSTICLVFAEAWGSVAGRAGRDEL